MAKRKPGLPGWHRSASRQCDPRGGGGGGCEGEVQGVRGGALKYDVLYRLDSTQSHTCSFAHR